ncbi:MAG: hypothetical protein PHR39_06045 [Actinomycetota bacterium]|nr:hypothetical protein [Actinomycetota bacterium]
MPEFKANMLPKYTIKTNFNNICPALTDIPCILNPSCKNYGIMEIRPDLKNRQERVPTAGNLPEKNNAFVFTIALILNIISVQL